MTKWYQIFPKSPWLSIYAWVVFCIFPFFFIFRSNELSEIIFGLLLTGIFFLAYRLSFKSTGWFLYVCLAIEITISLFMTFFYGYIYFSIFLSFFIGNITQKVGFFLIYSLNIVATLTVVIIGFFVEIELFISQWPFLVICMLGVILLPFSSYNRHKREMLEGQLEDANKRIAQYMVIEERERIARDLHDTLGQKLSMIGLKSDLAGRLMDKDPEAAKHEIQDIHQTARSVLKEVRELVTNMRGTKLEDEIYRVQQILNAAEISCKLVVLSTLLNSLQL